MMKHFTRIAICLLTLTCLAAIASEKQGVESDTETGIEANAQTKAMAAKIKAERAGFQTIEWTDLIPKADLDAIMNPPAYLSEIEDGSEDDVIGSQLRAAAGASATEDRYQQALVSTTIRPEYNGKNVRIPGFIVPLEFDDQQTVTTFFLVPFFGACIHVPPPPPNQVIYAEFEPGTELEALYYPFWISGKLSTTLVENDMATAAYSIDVTSIDPYTED
jgi:hypothetical protein